MSQYAWICQSLQELYLLQTVATVMPLAVTNARPQILSGTTFISAVFLAAPKTGKKSHQFYSGVISKH